MNYNKYSKLSRAFNGRLLAIYAMGFFLCAIIIGKLFFLQIVQGKKYKELAVDKHSVYANLEPERGEIFTREFSSKNIFSVAGNKITYNVYVEPKNIQNKASAVEILSKELDLDELKLKIILNKEDPYEPIAKNISEEKMQTIKNLGIKGVGFEKESKRIYPESNFGGQLLGFVGFEGHIKEGKYGLEGYFNKELAGSAGYIKGEKDAAGRLIPLASNDIVPAVNGVDLILTIDRGVQVFVCEKAREAVKRYEADLASILVMDPATGAVLGICSYPDYDSNNYNKVKELFVFNNPIIFSQYEPGSIFKPITMAVAIDSKVVSPESTYKDEGSVYIAPHTIKNSDGKANGVQTMTQVLEKSLNTGVIYVTRLMGAKVFRQYVENFGFGSLSGIELDGEVEGDVSSLKKKGEIWSATAAFGQGIAITPIQVLNAFNAIINGGTLMKPYIVDSKVYAEAEIKTEPKTIRQVVNSRTSALLRGMLANVVEVGHAKRAAVPGYYIGGKTGTAQVSKQGGGGYEEGIVITSFMGFAPIDSPKFSALVKIDNPKNVEWASSSAAPIFGEIAKFLLNYYKIPPER